jgi:hypothetical protein
LGISHVIWSPQRGVFGVIGVRVLIERDLTTVTRRYTYTESGIFGEGDTVSTSKKIGSTWATALITVGALFDL